MKHERKNMVGERFGRLLVVAYDSTKGGRAMWKCVCDCGRDSVVAGKLLRSEHTKSCGCLGVERRAAATKKHGASGGRDRTYNCWKDMRKRCNNPASDFYHRYGGRGIAVCHAWADYQVFLADMGPCPAGHSIERLDIDRGYEPGNCIWIPLNRQQRNTSRSRSITAFGETKLLVEWAEQLGVSMSLLRARIDRLGWSVEKALSHPAKKIKPRSASLT